MGAYRTGMWFVGGRSTVNRKPRRRRVNVLTIMFAHRYVWGKEYGKQKAEALMR